MRRPHDVNPSISSLRVILAIKNFSTIPGVCHIGLGVTATNTVKVLRKNGVDVQAWSISSPGGKGNEPKELKRLLLEDSRRPHYKPITHVIISAPSWILPNDFYDLALTWPDTKFVQLNHSGCAYLSIDKNGIQNIRDVVDYELGLHNIQVAANNERVARFISTSFGSDTVLLTNLYDTDSFVTPFTPQKIGDTLRIGSFGASRPWKNQLNAAEAAVMLGRIMGLNVELYVNSKRPDGGERMIESRAELFDNLSGCKIKYVPWMQWPKFRDLVGTMHIQFQPSFDETFDVCCADGIAEGTPCVASSALEWTPQNWWCDTPDPNSIARVALNLLRGGANAVEEGRTALRKYVGVGVHRWLDFLLGRKQIPY